MSCSVPGCARDVRNKRTGLCGMHYQRLMRNGDPSLSLRAPNGAGHAKAGGYRLVRIAGVRPRPEHVVIAERALGRSLPAGAEVHHLNGDKLDNRPSNLVICQDRAFHVLLHTRADALSACGNPDWRRCFYCDAYDEQARLIHDGYRYLHRACRARYMRERYQARKARGRAA